MPEIPNDALVQKATSNLSPEDKLIFENAYNKKSKNTGIAYLLWFFLGLHYAYLGQWGTQVIYWLTGGGFLIWAIIDLFRIPGLISNANRDVALKALHDVRVLK